MGQSRERRGAKHHRSSRRVKDVAAILKGLLGRNRSSKGGSKVPTPVAGRRELSQVGYNQLGSRNHYLGLKRRVGSDYQDRESIDQLLLKKRRLIDLCLRSGFTNYHNIGVRDEKGAAFSSLENRMAYSRRRKGSFDKPI